MSTLYYECALRQIFLDKNVGKGHSVIAPYRSFDEHMLVEFQDESLGMYRRTDDGIALSISMNGGRQWTLGRPTGLFGPASRFFIRRLQSGRLLLVYHDIESFKEETHPRHRLMAKLSDDDGIRWMGGVMIDIREEVSYPDGSQDEEGNIWIIHDYNRYDQGDLLLSRFREEDILAGELVSPQAEMRKTVASLKKDDTENR